MRKAALAFAAALACITACLLCTACGPTAADEARELIENDDLAGAVEKISNISDQTEKQAVLKEAAVKQYKSLCNSLTTFFSESGLQQFLYSKDVLGSQLGSSAAKVTPETLKSAGGCGRKGNGTRRNQQ